MSIIKEHLLETIRRKHKLYATVYSRDYVNSLLSENLIADAGDEDAPPDADAKAPQCKSRRSC